MALDGEEVKRETDKEETSDKETQTSDEKAQTSNERREGAGEPLTEGLQRRVASVYPKRIPPSGQAAFADLIRDLCDWKPLSATEVAHLIGKNQDYVANRLLSPLVEAGRLKRTPSTDA